MNNTIMDIIEDHSEIMLIYGVILFTGIVGNLMACAVIVTSKSMHTPANCYLFNLAISDLLLLLSGLPHELYLFTHHTTYLCTPTFCVIRTLISESCTNCTILTLCAFALKRYLIVCRPLWSYTMSSNSRTIKIILGIWLAAIAFSVFAVVRPEILEVGGKCFCQPPVISYHYFCVSAVLLFAVPMLFIGVLCILVCVELRRRVELPHFGGQWDAVSRKAVRLLSKYARAFPNSN